MNEMLLQFLWHQQLFHAADLSTLQGDDLQVLDPGVWNRNQGPDFLHARIRLGGQLWVGHVELHVQTSEWNSHGHQEDPNYANVVLHVVWEHNLPFPGNLPVLPLKERVPMGVLQKYQGWTWKQTLVPCEEDLRSMNAGIFQQHINLLAEERLMQKAGRIYERVRQLGMDWQEAFWQGMARSFGHRVNADAFESVASTLPYNILLKSRTVLLQIEALLMGQAALLRPDTGDEYAKQLFTEYGFLKKKYRLAKSYVPVHFLRMRPVNFPTVRLAQLSMLVHDIPDLFRMVKEWKDPLQIRQLLRVGTSAYWDNHYRFAETSVHQPKFVGDQLIHTVMVNTIIPFILSYHQHTGQSAHVERVLDWTRQLPAEANSIIHAFSLAGHKARDLKDTQGMLALHTSYCEKSQCAACAIGQWHLKNQHKDGELTVMDIGRI